MNALLVELAGSPGSGGTPQAVELDALAKQVAATEMVLNLLLVVILVFMVFKPGGPSP
jgi:hypothetical protein